jgi:hypothetical protein
METLQPYLSYLGIGAAIVGALVLLLWIGFAAMLSAATEGIPELLSKFFNYQEIGFKASPFQGEKDNSQAASILPLLGENRCQLSTVNCQLNELAMGDVETAYSLTSARFQQSISKSQMRKLVRKHQIDQHKRVLLPVSLPEGDRHAFDVTLILTSGREIPISIELVREGDRWIIDALSFPLSLRAADIGI